MQRAISQDDDAQGIRASVLAEQEIVRAQQIGHGMCQPWVSPPWCAADHAVVQFTKATRSLKVTSTTHPHHPPPLSVVQYYATFGEWSNITLHSQVVMYFVITFHSEKVANSI